MTDKAQSKDTVTERTLTCALADGSQRNVTYQLTRKKVKNINLRIKADGKVYVSAAARVPVSYIDDFVRSKAAYILHAQEELREQASKVQPARQYVDGEIFHILGKEKTLQVQENHTEKVWLTEEHLMLQVRDVSDIRRKERLIASWYAEQEQRVFLKICHAIHEAYFSDLPFPKIKIRTMKSRWGSCKPYGATITLNARLFEHPYGCIEYVVLHEFSHFVHPNHSRSFHAFVEERMPDWKARKRVLNRREALEDTEMEDSE